MMSDNDNGVALGASTRPASAKAGKPKSARRWAREFAVQALYELFVAGHEIAAVRLRTEGDPDFRRADKEFFRELWTGVTTDTDALINAVQPHVDRPFEQVSPIERSIILIGAWELRQRLDIPYRVAINESVGLAKTFGGTDGHKWVNGVLDKLAPLLRAEEVAAAPARGKR